MRILDFYLFSDFRIMASFIHYLRYLPIHSLNHLTPLFLQNLFLQSQCQELLLVLYYYILLLSYQYFHSFYLLSQFLLFQLPLLQLRLSLLLHVCYDLLEFLVVLLVSFSNEVKSMILFLHFEALQLKRVLLVFQFIELFALSQDLDKLFLLLNKVSLSVYLLEQLFDDSFAFDEKRLLSLARQLLKEEIPTLLHI